MSLIFIGLWTITATRNFIQSQDLDRWCFIASVSKFITDCVSSLESPRKLWRIFEVALWLISYDNDDTWPDLMVRTRHGSKEQQELCSQWDSVLWTLLDI